MAFSNLTAFILINAPSLINSSCHVYGGGQISPKMALGPFIRTNTVFSFASVLWMVTINFWESLSCIICKYCITKLFDDFMKILSLQIIKIVQKKIHCEIGGPRGRVVKATNI